MKKRIAVITIGGTFFMKGKTLKPSEVQLPPLRALKPPEITSHRFETLEKFQPEQVEIEHHPLFNIDSSEIRTEHLNDLGEKITELSNNSTVDGIVVLSGTDKMHAIVTRMAHHLHNLKKPVIFTGAQVQISQQGSDARLNYEQAVRAAYDLSKGKLRSVLLCFGLGGKKFGGELYHPLNALKAQSEKLAAFDHPYKRVVGTVTYEGGVKTTALGKKMLHVKERWVKRYGLGTMELARRLPGRKQERETEFTPVREGLMEEVKLSETKAINRIYIDKAARVIKLEGTGKGNVYRDALEKVAKLARGRPVIVTTEAGAYVDLTAYEPGLIALQKGMLPSGGLISTSAGIRAEYMAHQLPEIIDYSHKHPKGEITQEEFQRKLFAALYLSGAKFHGREAKQRHEKALGIQIAKSDLLINTKIEDALEIAARTLFKPTPRGKTKKKQSKYEKIRVGGRNEQFRSQAIP